MKLWLISQTANSGYDTFDSMVVAAATEDDARMMNPYGKIWPDWEVNAWSPWVHPDNVTVALIGEALSGAERGVILASFNAG